MRQQMQVTSPDGFSKVTGVRVLFLCLGLILLLPTSAVAQTTNTVAPSPKVVSIDPDRLSPFKLKPTRNLTSGRVRIGDYVQFQLIEDVKYPYDGGWDRDTIISKDTPVYGQVVDRRHRFTGFKKGRFSIGKLWTTTVDGQRVDLDITRPEMPPEQCVNKIPEKTRDALRKAAKDHAEPKGAKLETQSAPRVNCINGRVYAATLISSLPSALLAVATATALVRVKDDNATDAVIAVTLADKIASQSGLSNLINGVDAEIEKDEIFDSTILTWPLVIKIPLKNEKPARGGEQR